jgi:hypothetical protein
MLPRLRRGLPGPLPSPCKDICKLEASASTCTGCGRTIAEIAEWGSATASRQYEIIGRSSARRGNQAFLPIQKA